MKKKPIYRCFAVLDPKPGLVSASRIKELYVHPDSLLIAHELIPFPTIIRCELVDGAIHLSMSNRNLCFGIQGYDSRGKSSPGMTQSVSELIDALIRHDDQGVKLSLDHLDGFRRAYRIRNTIAILICLVIGLSFGIVMVLPSAVERIGEFIDRISGTNIARLYVWLGIGIIVLANAITIGLLKLRKHKTKSVAER